MFGNPGNQMLNIFKGKRIKVYIASHGSDKTTVIEGTMIDYKLVGGFWVIDDKIYIPVTSVLYIELV